MKLDEKKAGLDLHVRNFYEKFEHLVVYILTLLIAAIIIVALYSLVKGVTLLLFKGAVDDIIGHKGFQVVFGNIMTLLIALEFKHSIFNIIEHRESIIQVRTVFLIALLAISRKFILLDTKETPFEMIFALGGVVIALSAGYWLIQDREKKMVQNP